VSWNRATFFHAAHTIQQIAWRELQDLEVWRQGWVRGVGIAQESIQMRSFSNNRWRNLCNLGLRRQRKEMQRSSFGSLDPILRQGLIASPIHES
jgi:hypothetical protein